MKDELIAWVGCQNCHETAKMPYEMWAEKMKSGICPAGSDMHLAKCAKALREVAFF